MKNIVLIPAWQRPEYLVLCLDQIQKAENASDYAYVFLLDKGYSPENLTVIETFPFEKATLIRPKTVSGIGKQSMNILEGYRWAAEQGCRLVFMIEEDIMIANDFFIWHEAVHSEFDLLCSIATENNNTHHESKGNLEEFYFGSFRDYQSLGVCWNRNNLKKYIIPHCRKEYYMNPVRYVTHTYPKSVMGSGFAEQDGLIRRIREFECALPVAFPDVPRAFHSGFYGYNRPSQKKPIGSIPNKVGALKEIIFNPENMLSHSINEGYYQDSKPINLINEKWHQQRKQI